MSPLYYIELASIESLIFDTFMDHLVSLHVFTLPLCWSEEVSCDEFCNNWAVESVEV